MAEWLWSPSVLERSDGTSLAYQIVSAGENARSRLLLVHGHGEYAYRYRAAVESFCDRGISVTTFDLRGHGDSGGVRGHVANFQEYVDDVVAVLDQVAHDPGFGDARPPVLLGHSLGGLIAIRVAQERPDRIAGLVLTSPFLGLSLPVPAVERVLARAISRWYPTFSRPTRIRGSQRTRDPDLARESDGDSRLVRVATARFFVESERAQHQALSRAQEMSCPVFCVQAGDDQIASAPATQAFMSKVRAAGSTFELLPEARHEILHDTPRREWTRRLGDVVLSMGAAERSPLA